MHIHDLKEYAYLFFVENVRVNLKREGMSDVKKHINTLFEKNNIYWKYVLIIF